MHFDHKHGEGATVKYVSLRDIGQFENDSRRILQHHRAFVPRGPLEIKDLRSGTRLIRQRFEQIDRRLTWDQIDNIVEPLIDSVLQAIRR